MFDVFVIVSVNVLFCVFVVVSVDVGVCIVNLW